MKRKHILIINQGIREELAESRVARTLTLIAKTLQNVGNLTPAIGLGKVRYASVHVFVNVKYEINIYTNTFCMTSYFM